MRAELGYTKDQCSKFFPALQELSDISREFLARLRKRQSDETPIVEHFADVLYDFWNSGYSESHLKYNLTLIYDRLGRTKGLSVWPILCPAA